MLRRELPNNTKRQNKNIGEPAQTEAVPKRATLYSLVYGPTPIDTPRRESDSVTNDETIVFPAASPYLNGQPNTKPRANIIPDNRHDRLVHRLPPIAHQQYPLEYNYRQPSYRHTADFYGFHPVQSRNQLPRYHQNRGETYDPRWWYMPINSVHAPKFWRPNNYYYTPPKWYELPSKR